MVNSLSVRRCIESGKRSTKDYLSFTSNEQGDARSQDDIVRDLYSALAQFFRIYTDYALNPFYVTGQSYAGKYVPSIAYKIHVENQNPDVQTLISLKDAFYISDALIDGDLINITTYFAQVTGLKSSSNILLTSDPSGIFDFVPFITQAYRRKQIHVGNRTFNGRVPSDQPRAMLDLLQRFLLHLTFNN
ncbi:unnamed protein product [Didymodactylos carnosus]|uniref:Carboxypeptidase n=1 Tax=Didymodactylos carnosus TaxID=1234261 RepID=A0A814YXS4_9BILA|nr:unnamed protein product [Didymodactylos carnosus]CAF3997861.1 unnamed protein product [Didymodactylos carnosus]